jgi:hypothetical protein
MPIPQQSQVETVLSAREDVLVQVILDAWESSAPDRARHEFKRTHRCIVHDHAIRGARAKLLGQPGVHMYEKHETAYLLFDDAVVVRIKKGDQNGLGRNNHTQASFAFTSADAEPWELPIGLPDVQRADVVYLLNEFETKIEAILVTGRDGNKVLWNYPLYPRRSMPVAVLPSLPKPPVDPAGVLRVPGEADSVRDEKKAG